jgi:hypothetical protein
MNLFVIGIDLERFGFGSPSAKRGVQAWTTGGSGARQFSCPRPCQIEAALEIKSIRPKGLDGCALNMVGLGNQR